jgi:hypothetical protein
MDRALDTAAKLDALSPTCAGCGRFLDKGRGFGFKAVPAEASRDPHAQSNDIVKCLFCAIRHIPMVRRSLKVAVVVGTVLILLNQGDTIFSGAWPNALYWKIPLTYCVPFSVATFGALSNGRR